MLSIVLIAKFLIRFGYFFIQWLELFVLGIVLADRTSNLLACNKEWSLSLTSFIPLNRKLGRTSSVPIIDTICLSLVQEYHDLLPPPDPGPVADHHFAAQDIVVLNKMIAGYNQPGRRASVCKGVRLRHLHYDFDVNLWSFRWYATAATLFPDTNFQPRCLSYCSM